MPIISINSSPINFITLKGELQELALQVEDVTRKGVNGAAFRQTANRSEPRDLMAIVDCDSFDAAKTLYETLKNAQGTLVAITDDFGELYPNQMLLKVEKSKQKPLLAAAGGVSTHKKALLTLKLTVQATNS